MTVLVFGFEPYLEYDENHSQLIAQSLDGKEIEGARPELVIGFGLAPRRDSITPEKIAANYRFSEESDNAGKKMGGAPIDESQPDGLFSSIPVEGLVASLRSLGFPASLSLSAGGYLCNNAMFVIVREAKKRGFAEGFIHVPCRSEWVARKGRPLPSLPLATMVHAAEHCVAYSLRDGTRSKG